MIQKIYEREQNTYRVATALMTEQVQPSLNKMEINNICYEKEEKQYQDASILENYSKQQELKEKKKTLDITNEQLIGFQQQGYCLDELSQEEINQTGILEKKIQPKKNILSTIDIKEKIRVIKEERDNMYLNSLKQKEPITIGTLYKNSYIGEYKKMNAPTNQEVLNVLNLNQLPDTQGNGWAVEKLLSYGMDVTKQDITKLQNLKVTVANLDEQENIQEKEKEDEPLIEKEEVLYREETIRKIKEDLEKVNPKHVKEVLAKNQDLTIGNLKKALYENTKTILDGKTEKQVLSEETVQETMEQVKEQIDSIRRKLTVEAARNISRQMPLESSRLTEVAAQLEKEHIQIAKQSFKNAGIVPDDKQLELFEQTICAKQTIAEYKKETADIEINTQLKENTQVSIQEIDEVLVAYKDNETLVDKRFGESVAVVENQIEHFLDRNQLPNTEVYKKAAKALITNELDITVENLEKAVAIMNKLDIFIEELTPMKVANLIKEGNNPYTASIDQILGWVGEDRVTELKESVAQVIVALEEKGQITKEQKQAMVGLYKILVATEKNKEAIAGYLYRNKLPLTIERLQEAAKYVMHKENINTMIDENFGELEELKRKQISAKDMIYQNTEKVATVIETVKGAEQLVVSSMESLYPMIKQHFKREMNKFEGLKTLPKSFLEKLDVVKNVDLQVIEAMDKQNIPKTISNIYWVSKMTEDPMYYKELLEKNHIEKNDWPKTIEQVVETLHKLEKETSDKKDHALLKSDLNSYQNNKQLHEVVKLQKDYFQKQGFYQIPFIVDGKATVVNLYIDQKTKKKEQKEESLKAIMTYETKHLGTITTHIEMLEDKINYKIQTQSQQTARMLEVHSDEVKDMLQSIGYVLKNGQYKHILVKPKEILPEMMKKGISYFEELI